MTAKRASALTSSRRACRRSRESPPSARAPSVTSPPPQSRGRVPEPGEEAERRRSPAPRPALVASRWLLELAADRHKPMPAPHAAGDERPGSERLAGAPSNPRPRPQAQQGEGPDAGDPRARLFWPRSFQPRSMPISSPQASAVATPQRLASPNYQAGSPLRWTGRDRLREPAGSSCGRSPGFHSFAVCTTR